MDTFLMSAKERARMEVFGRVREGELTLRGASEVLGLSYRQTKRSWARYLEQGAHGLVHRLRGEPSNRQGDAELKRRALELYAENYADYGPTLAAECLAEEDHMHVPAETLRRWLKSAGLWTRKRRRKQHRRRRPRKEHFGELVQMDGSIHDWFERRRGEAVLMVMIDDATGCVLARFFEKETLAAAWSVFRLWIEQHGLPRALYVDRHSIYRSDREPTSEELLAGHEPPTQFSRSLEQLEVGLIKARSPQAKGRVERMNGTLQDRLVKALRRAEISDLETANKFLEAEFLDRLNDRFAIPPAQDADLHRTLDSQVDLDAILAVHEDRVVQNDWTVRWRNRFLQLPRKAAKTVEPGDTVTVCQQADGRLRVFAGDMELDWSPTRSEPVSQRKRRRGKSPETRSSQGQKPAADHPWRRPYKPVSTTAEACDSPPPAAASELAGSAPGSLRSPSAPPANSETS